jgi:hypothetical protein
MKENFTWKGKLLNDYSKEELINIIVFMEEYYENRIQEKQHQIEVIRELRKGRE